MIVQSAPGRGTAVPEDAETASELAARTLLYRSRHERRRGIGRDRLAPISAAAPAGWPGSARDPLLRAMVPAVIALPEH